MKRTLHLTSPLTRGLDVEYARNLLQHGGFLLVGGLHGSAWDEEAATAARKAKWVYGYPADECKGTFGTKLEYFLKGHPLPFLYARRARARAAADYGANAVREAELWVGTKETPPNSNIAKPFTPWYGWVGWGAPWCAVFVSYCLAKAGFKYIDPNAAQWAYCPYFLRDAREGRKGLRVVTGAQVREGTVVLFDWDDDGVPDHIGLCRGPVVSGKVPTIEGNTSSSTAGDQSNGGEVCLKIRSISDVIAFVRVG